LPRPGEKPRGLAGGEERVTGLYLRQTKRLQVWRGTLGVAVGFVGELKK